MRWVEVAARLPQRCAFIPYIGAHSPRGFFQADFELPGGDTPYVSVVALEEMAREIGWYPPGEQQAYDRVLAVKDTEIRGLREQLEAAEQKLAAVQVLKEAGYTAGRKPGRPRKTTEVV